MGIILKALSRGKIIKSKQKQTNCHGYAWTTHCNIEHVDTFIGLSARLGTLEEVFIIISWAWLKFHQKPIELDVNHYYDLIIIWKVFFSFGPVSNHQISVFQSYWELNQIS